jgi:hypothetical protein
VTTMLICTPPSTSSLFSLFYPTQRCSFSCTTMEFERVKSQRGMPNPGTTSPLKANTPWHHGRPRNRELEVKKAFIASKRRPLDFPKTRHGGRGCYGGRLEGRGHSDCCRTGMKNPSRGGQNNVPSPMGHSKSTKMGADFYVQNRLLFAFRHLSLFEVSPLLLF